MKLWNNKISFFEYDKLKPVYSVHMYEDKIVNHKKKLLKALRSMNVNDFWQKITI